MFDVLIDTCVWLDLAQDLKQTPLLLVVENMVREELVRLIVPRIVVDEFTRNRARVAQASARSLKGHVSQVKEAINRVDGNARRKKALLAHFDDLSHRAPILGGAAETALSRIEKLFANAEVVEASDAAKLKAADRAINKKAPCHHDNKNSVADALVIETFFEGAVAGGLGIAVISLMSPAPTPARRPLLSHAQGLTSARVPQGDAVSATAGQVGIVPAPYDPDRAAPPGSAVSPSPGFVPIVMPQALPRTAMAPIETRPYQAPAPAVTEVEVFRSPTPLDCNATSSLAQNMVCTDVELAASEVTLRRLFEAAEIAAYNRSPDEAKALVAGYAASSAERDACGDRACLSGWFARREIQLRALSST